MGAYIVTIPRNLVIYFFSPRPSSGGLRFLSKVWWATERGGFGPPNGFRHYLFSGQAPSTTRPTFHAPAAAHYGSEPLDYMIDGSY